MYRLDLTYSWLPKASWANPCPLGNLDQNRGGEVVMAGGSVAKGHVGDTRVPQGTLTGGRRDQGRGRHQGEEMLAGRPGAPEGHREPPSLRPSSGLQEDRLSGMG